MAVLLATYRQKILITRLVTTDSQSTLDTYVLAGNLVCSHSQNIISLRHLRHISIWAGLWQVTSLILTLLSRCMVGGIL